MDWLQAFNQASMNAQTVNAFKNQSEWGKINQDRAEQEAFEKALAAEEPDAMANYGYWLYTSGNKEQGYKWMAKAVIKGESVSLANFNWYKLMDGEHEDAITLYNACRNSVNRNVTEYGLANIDSNHILNMFAAGNDVPGAEKRLLVAGATTNHTESKFIPIQLAHNAGDFAKRNALAEQLTKAQWKEMKDGSLQNQLTAKGWFKKWSSENYKLIELLGH